MVRHLSILALLLVVSPGESADLKKVDRKIAKEPTYQSKSPGYVLLAIGPEAKDRVWVVRDGDTLYVDRNGDGDLTGKDERFTAKKGTPNNERRLFEVGELKLGDKKHTDLKITFHPLKQMMAREYVQRADLQAILKADPDAEVMWLMGDFEAPHLRAKGRVPARAGPIDLNGALMATTKPADAPIVHLAGPVQITFFPNRPTMRRNNSTEFILVAGTPGLGGGTFAMLNYDDTIPKEVRPVADIAFPPAKSGDKPIKKQFVLKERC